MMRQELDLTVSIIESPEEPLQLDDRCPRTQGQVTDNLLTRVYDAGARAGHIGNSLSPLMLALSASLQETGADPSTTSLSDASLQAYALSTRELGENTSFPYSKGAGC